MSKLKKILIATSIVLSLGSVGVATLLVTLVKAVRVPTGSMANTIVPGDHLIVIKYLGEIGRGDIVVFKFPRDQSVQYVGRVVGLPQETIEVRERSVYINGSEIPEEKVTVKFDEVTDSPLEEISSEGSGPYRVFYWPRDEATASRQPNDYSEATFGTAGPFQIPEGQYFLMGDNRDNSYDSRFYGTVARELIWGESTLVYWSAYDGRILKRLR